MVVSCICLKLVSSIGAELAMLPLKLGFNDWKDWTLPSCISLMDRVLTIGWPPQSCENDMLLDNTVN